MVMVAVLGMLLVAAVLVTQLSDAGTAVDRLVSYTRAREQNYLIARSVLEMGLELIRADDNDADGPGDTWAIGEQATEWQGHLVRLGILDEESRFPLGSLMENPDDEKLRASLIRLARRAGLDAEKAVDSLLDWVDADGTPRSSGSEASPDGRVPVKNAPLDSLAELRFLPLWTPPALPRPLPYAPEGLMEQAGLEPTPTATPRPAASPPAASQWSDWLSLYSSGKVNINTAPPELLASLDEEMTDVTVQEIVSRRQEELFHGAQDLQRVPGINSDLLFRLQEQVAFTSRTFTVRASIDDLPGRVTVRAVVRRGQKMTVLLWQVE